GSWKMSLPRFRGRVDLGFHDSRGEGRALCVRPRAPRDRGCHLRAFESGRRDIADRGMPPSGVVPAFDEIEDRGAGGGRIRPRSAREELALERGEEAFTERVVIAVADGSHRGADARLAAPRAKGDRRVLTALIRVMDHRRWPPLLHR